ncbi:hypothetical protein [Nitrospirillum viridazoti]|uniref:Uncharacterized protein n=2 Tax=Nitrospirillum TaxID=1543705 RepID=A0A248JLS7_9PROT|nr:hypothetical protein [Nitrospirillum amazonense]ASG19496.1 hypothetical protein Y958_00645 [Nitrospirillum amazonense CBAmc]TWB26746.1 hypothetical protein FBZ91_13725 [Nitrospirillum amazonense]TWB49639.1 hypothetical protein FBZ92_12576 [Nitrospirillum amazonense]
MMVHHEPRLTDMLEDPVVRLVMERDGVYRDDVLKLMASVARKATKPAVKAAAPKVSTAEPALAGHA